MHFVIRSAQAVCLAVILAAAAVDSSADFCPDLGTKNNKCPGPFDVCTGQSMMMCPMYNGVESTTIESGPFNSSDRVTRVNFRPASGVGELIQCAKKYKCKWVADPGVCVPDVTMFSGNIQAVGFPDVPC